MADTNGTQEVKTTEGGRNTEELQSNARSQLEQLLTLVRMQASNTAKTSCEADIRSMISDISSSTPTELPQMLQAIKSLEAVVDAMTDNNTGSKPSTNANTSTKSRDTEAEVDSDEVDAAAKTILIAYLLKNLLDKNPELLETIVQTQNNSNPDNKNIADLLNVLNVLKELSAPEAQNLANNIKSLDEDAISKLTDFLAKIIKTPSEHPEPKSAEVQGNHSRGGATVHC